jgi:hypothetical protein
MAGGPSKEELQMYWQNSRQYFDELANHYRQADPEYYRTNIQPFYDNPFANIPSNKRSGSGGARLAVVAVALLVLVAGAGGVFFLVFQSEIKTETDKLEKKLESGDEKNIKEKDPAIEKEFGELNTPAEEEDTDGMNSDDHFIVGSKKIADKDYDKAEYHLKKVKPGSQYYKQAKELLKNLSLLRKYDK